MIIITFMASRTGISAIGDCRQIAAWKLSSIRRCRICCLDWDRADELRPLTAGHQAGARWGHHTSRNRHHLRPSAQRPWLNLWCLGHWLRLVRCTRLVVHLYSLTIEGGWEGEGGCHGLRPLPTLIDTHCERAPTFKIYNAPQKTCIILQ